MKMLLEKTFFTRPSATLRWMLCLGWMLAGMAVESKAGEPVAEIEVPLPHKLERESWTLGLSGAYLQKVISPNATFRYRLVPVLLNLKSPGFAERQIGHGTFTIRNSTTLIAQPMFQGPETRYFGLSLQPSLEWWRADERFHIALSVGGGAGVLDSRGIVGGQGQDFTLNIHAWLGMGWKLAERSSLRVGLMFQHLSNGGQTDQNPGLNSVGPELGFTYQF